MAAASSLASWVYPPKHASNPNGSTFLYHVSTPRFNYVCMHTCNPWATPSSHVGVHTCTPRVTPRVHVCTHTCIAESKFEQAHSREEVFAPVVLVDLLHHCKNLASANEAHSIVVQSGYDFDVYVGTNLVQLFTRLNNLPEACRMFNKIEEPNVISWTSVISAHSRLGQEEQGIKIYHKMRECGIEPDGHAVVSVLDACANITAIEEGMQIHEYVVASGLESNVYVGNALVTMYAWCGSLEEASTAFARAPMQDVITWSALMGGYIQQGYEQGVFELIEKMQQKGVEPNLVTYVHVLEACSSINAVLEPGMLAHACIIENGFDQDELLGSALIDMYAKSGLLQEAHKVFDELSRRDIVTWTSLIAGYATQEDEGHAQISLQLYERMQLEGVQPNNIAYLSVLKACTIVATLEYGKKVHQKIVDVGFEGDIHVSGSIIDMYMKCGRLEDAFYLFDKLATRNVVIWSSLIMGHIELGHGDKALELFCQMQQEGIEPDTASFVCILKACTSVAALEQGKLFHGNIVKRGFEIDVHVGSTLIHMYSSCGSLDDAVAVFERLQTRNVVIYNALITGYAQNNNFILAYKSFKDMKQFECRPNNVTFLSLLIACSNLILVKEGCYIFKLMRDEHAMVPVLDHYNTIVDIFGHAGLLHESEDLIETMPFKSNMVGWVSLLSSCRTYGNIAVGRRSFRMVVTIEPLNASGYVLMSDIYCHVGLQEHADRMEQLRLSVNAWKVPGRSYIEIDNQVHTFVVGKYTHPRIHEIYAKLEEIMKKMRQEGPLPYLITKPGKRMRDDLCGHSEKLAVGLGLISTPKGKTLRILKNLCMCTDCHAVMMFTSRMEERKIVLIDAFCVHEFEDGACTCSSPYYRNLHSTTNINHV